MGVGVEGAALFQCTLSHEGGMRVEVVVVVVLVAAPLWMPLPVHWRRHCVDVPCMSASLLPPRCMWLLKAQPFTRICCGLHPPTAAGVLQGMRLRSLLVSQFMVHFWLPSHHVFPLLLVRCHLVERLPASLS